MHHEIQLSFLSSLPQSAASQSFLLFIYLPSSRLEFQSHLKLSIQKSAGKKKERTLSSSQFADGGERRHVMCVGARSGSKPGPLGTGALTNCASCPVKSAENLNFDSQNQK
jgi:hypothetical protein